MPGQFPPPPGEGPPPPFYTPNPAGGYFPLDIGRVFGLTFSLFRFKWRTFVGIALIVMIPATLLLMPSTWPSVPPRVDFSVQLQDVARGGTPQIAAAQITATALSFVVGANRRGRELRGPSGHHPGRAGNLRRQQARDRIVGPLRLRAHRDSGRCLFLIVLAVTFAVVLVGALIAGVAFLATFIRRVFRAGAGRFPRADRVRRRFCRARISDRSLVTLPAGHRDRAPGRGRCPSPELAARGWLIVARARLPLPIRTRRRSAHNRVDLRHLPFW